MKFTQVLGDVDPSLVAKAEDKLSDVFTELSFSRLIL